MSQFDDSRVRVRVQTKPAVELSVIDAGPRQARPVLLFVQGAGGHALQWVNQLRYFSQHHRCLAPDLRGHGKSQRTPGKYDYDHDYGDLQAFLDSVVGEPAFVMGHSRGGVQAAMLASRNSTTDLIQRRATDGRSSSLACRT